MKNQILTDFSHYRDGDLDSAAQLVALLMTNNSYFPMLQDKVAAVAAASDGYHGALLAAQRGGTEAHSLKDDKRSALVKALRILGMQINIEADGDRTKLESTGYPLAKPRTGGRKVQEGITLKAGYRSVTITVNGNDDAEGYMVQYTLYPFTESSVWTGVFMTASSLRIDGLESNSRYAFKVAPVIHGQSPVYSEPVISKFTE